MSNSLEFFVTCAKGVEDLLLRECEQAGVSKLKQQTGGVGFSGELIQAYRVCLWSRVGSRVLLKLADFNAKDYDLLYSDIGSIDWSEHMSVDNSFAVDCFSAHKSITNSHFASLKTKDAIVDQFRKSSHKRPDVVKQRPDIRINIYIDHSNVIVYLDLSGEGLHQRGYRQSTGPAPLRETLAAAMLYRCKWPQMAEQNKPLMDCMCGSATLLIEAAMMAQHRAPGLLRDYFGFLAWKQHDERAWSECLQAAQQAMLDISCLPELVGYDISGKAIKLAKQNIAAADLVDSVQVYVGDCTHTLPQLPATPGLMLTNPPYGKRIGEIQQLKDVYFKLGKQLKTRFSGWHAALITPVKELAQCIGLRSHHQNTLYNGALKCTLYQYRIREYKNDSGAPAVHTNESLHENAEMFANRLAKNLKHLKKWARKNTISCYRIYDADIPQYAVAVDLYDDWVQVFEYQAPKSVNAGRSMQRISDVVAVLQQTLNVPREKIVLKTRKRQSGSEQYTLQDAKHNFKTVMENGLRFSVNLHDYLDTGLFLDHRSTRSMLAEMCKAKTVLNLFAYTGSFTVYAAAGGAKATTTVDLSNTYIDWAKANLKLNKLNTERHEFVRADCFEWMHSQQGQRKWDIIVLDPPTFSNSKSMEQTLDIKRDHVALIELAMRLLSKHGVLIFSTNAKRFKLDTEKLSAYTCKDISQRTLTEDYKRKPAHKCWFISNDC